MRTVSFLALIVGLLAASSNGTVAQPKGPPAKPLEIYSKFRDTMSEGKYDIAGLFLDDFLKSGPTDDDLLKLQEKHGTTVFKMLQTVPRYSDDAATEKKIRDNIEVLVKRLDKINTDRRNDPARIAKYVRNLGATYEEKVYAQIELEKTGAVAVPYLIAALRANPGKDLAAGILETIPMMNKPSMAGWVAALDALPPDRQYEILSYLGKRRDRLELVENAQTDFTPHLWYLLLQPPANIPKELRELAVALLNVLVPGRRADTRDPDAELTAAARRFYDHDRVYLRLAVDPKEGAQFVTLWMWDPTIERVVPRTLARRDADEYYGVRYAKWVLSVKPEFEAAQSLILSLATERAVERARFGNLALAEPAVYKLLSDAPSATLNLLLARGLAEKRTALVLATVQALGDRADRDAATPPAGPTRRPSLLEKALKYPDPQVQFAAATALLRSPVPVSPETKPLIVDILRRAAGNDPGVPGASKGTVLLADPGLYRADANALLLRSFGFNVEVYKSGRELLRRVTRASDFDIIFIDHHTADPELIDLVSQLRSDVKVSARPLFVIASADKPRVPTFDQLLLRTSCLIAATEHDIIVIPAPYTPDPLYTPDEQAKMRVAVGERRDAALRSAANARIGRLRRVIDTLPLTLTEQQKLVMDLRIQLMTYAILEVEFPITRESSPEVWAEVVRLKRQLALQPLAAPYGTGIPSQDLIKLIERFEPDVAKVAGAQAKYDLLRSRLDPAEIGLTVETFRDQVIEAKLTKAFREYPGVRVIPEPYSRLALEAELAEVLQDPTMMPRDPAAKQTAARQSVDYLRQMATGEIAGYRDLLKEDTEQALRDALRLDDLAGPAVDALEKFKTASAQQALLAVATDRDRPLPLRMKAADASIRHIRAYNSAANDLLKASLVRAADDPTTDPTLRGKLLTLKGMIVSKPGEFLDQLKGYDPLPKPEPKKDPPPPPPPPPM